MVVCSYFVESVASEASTFTQDATIPSLIKMYNLRCAALRVNGASYFALECVG